MPRYEFFLTDSLQKVFPDQRPRVLADSTVYAIPGEVPAVQLVYYRERSPEKVNADVSCTVDVEGAPVEPRMRSVELVPSDYPTFDHADDNYLRTSPGLYPDLLRPLQEARIKLLADQYRALWIDFPGLTATDAGEYDIKINVTEPRAPGSASTVDTSGNTVDTAGSTVDMAIHTSCCLTLKVASHALPKQRTRHTEWFHTDGLIQYYGVDFASEDYWRIVENFIISAKNLRVNLLLTPVFTPPLDTAVGGERTTVQLVDIIWDGQYHFDFTKLRRWCGICREHGIEFIEVPHFFTQWGAKATPKIVALVDGKEERIFGWEVPATDRRYADFLAAFIPALRAELADCGYPDSQVYYHISDEPGMQHLQSYAAARDVVAGLLDSCQIIDALSDYEFYQNGLVRLPIPADDSIQPFIDNGVEPLWVYYCCAQGYKVPNRFFSMPSARNRILGVLMYQYDIRGFLHWGFNFYNSQYSTRPINPFITTDAGHAFPSGDAFLVYPGEDGGPLSSIRAEVLRAAFDDIRALELLEGLTSREEVMQLVNEGLANPLTFTDYPKEADYLIDLHRKVCQAVEAER